MFPNEMFLLEKMSCMWSRFWNGKGVADCEVSPCAQGYEYDGIIKSVCKETQSTQFQQKFHREKLKLLFQILCYYFSPHNFKDSIYFCFIIPRFSGTRVVNSIYYKYEAYSSYS